MQQGKKRITLLIDLEASRILVEEKRRTGETLSEIVCRALKQMRNPHLPQEPPAAVDNTGDHTALTLSGQTSHSAAAVTGTGKKGLDEARSLIRRLLSMKGG